MNHTQAINWIKKAQDLGIDDGIPAFYNSEKNVWFQSYPEVSGYIIPTLIDAGEEERALKISRWLRLKQLSDGSIGSGYWNSYFPNAFDTGQVLLGWLAAQKIDLMHVHKFLLTVQSPGLKTLGTKPSGETQTKPTHLPSTSAHSGLSRKQVSPTGKTSSLNSIPTTTFLASTNSSLKHLLLTSSSTLPDLFMN